VRVKVKRAGENNLPEGPQFRRDFFLDSGGDCNLQKRGGGGGVSYHRKRKKTQPEKRTAKGVVLEKMLHLVTHAGKHGRSLGAGRGERVYLISLRRAAAGEKKMLFPERGFLGGTEEKKSGARLCWNEGTRR